MWLKVANTREQLLRLQGADSAEFTSWLTQHLQHASHWAVVAAVVQHTTDPLQLHDLADVVAALARLYHKKDAGSHHYDVPGFTKQDQQQLHQTLRQLLFTTRSTQTRDSDASLAGTCVSRLLQDLQVLGLSEQKLSGLLLQHVQLERCSADELSSLIGSAAAAGVLLRSSWLQRFTRTALKLAAHAQGGSICGILWGMARYVTQMLIAMQCLCLTRVIQQCRTCHNQAASMALQLPSSGGRGWSC